MFKGTSVTHLQRLDLVQQAAERMCQFTFLLLSSRRLLVLHVNFIAFCVGGSKGLNVL